MFVTYVGHDRVVMTDYNGKRYSFEKNVPKEIPEEVYKSILLSGHISAMDFKQVEAPKEQSKEEEHIPIKETIKKFIKPKHKKR